MQLLSVHGFSRELAQSEYFKSVSRKASKDLLLDKCHWLITEIARRGFGQDKRNTFYVNLDSSTLKDFLGRQYKDIVDLLVELHVVQVNDSYKVNQFSKSYRLHPRAVKKGLVPTNVLSKRFETKILEQRQAEYHDVMTHELYRRLLTHTANLKLLASPQEIFIDVLQDAQAGAKPAAEPGQVEVDADAFINRMDRYHHYAEALQALNHTTQTKDLALSSIFYPPRRSEVGRIYHLGASIPRIIRQHMVTSNDEPLWEVDMASAQLSLLFLEYFEYLRGRTTVQEYAREKKIANYMFRTLLDASIYASIQGDSEFSKMPYDKFKKTVLMTINDEYKPTPMTERLELGYPYFMKWLKELKAEHGHQYVSRLAFKAESSIFIGVFESLPAERFAIPIHDCILTTRQNAKDIQSRLIQAAIKRYPSILQSVEDAAKMFRIKRVTITN